MNRRVHSATGATPYELWWNQQPDLSSLKVFGSRVCVKVTGKRRAKLDRHDFNGIFIGYTAMDDNIRYIDEDSGIVKSSHHAVFDEAWYLQAIRPPMAQLLYDMGMEVEEEIEKNNLEQRQTSSHWPPMPTTPPLKLPSKAKNTPIPLRLSPAPIQTTTTARAARLTSSKLNIIEDMQLDKNEVFDQIYLSPSPYHDAFEEDIDLRRWTSDQHSTAGLITITKNDRLILANIAKSTPAARIQKWRTRCRGAWIMEVNGIPVSSPEEVAKEIRRAKDLGQDKCKITMAHPEVADGLTSTGIPQVKIDQFNPRFVLNLDCLAKQRSIYQESGGVRHWAFNKLTRGKLIRQSDWKEWEQAEFLQLDQYMEQGMFGEPVKIDDHSNVFFLVWSYAVKEVDQRKKARCTCDGSSRGGKVRVLDYTHANCVDHVASRAFYAIAAAENMLVFGADVSNAFSEAAPPKQGFYIQPDKAFRAWWIARGHKPLDDDDVIPVRRAMQGHPESSRLWEKHCDKIIRKLGFTPTKHEPCLYVGYIDGERVLFKRQVDDFAVATRLEDTAHKMFDLIDEELTYPMKRMGLVRLFNGIDVTQSRYYIKLSCTTYIEKMCDKYIKTWMKDLKDIANRPLPMPATQAFIKKFDTAQGTDDPKQLERMKKEYGFGYRNGIGELIYAMVTTRPDISTTVVRCAQHSAKPAPVHFHAVRHAIKYLYTTKEDGIYYWRTTPNMDLPEHELPKNSIHLHGTTARAERPQHKASEPHVFVDSDWATCPRTRRSISGISIKMAGGVISYKTKFQPTVALSSTEAEFMAACDAGKQILYVRSILWDLEIPQHAATVIYEDNDACTAMANAQKPTSRTRHMDIRYFALADWVELDLMVLERIDTSLNEADHLTKILDRTLFYRHVDYMMGRIPPTYSPCHEILVRKLPKVRTDDIEVENIEVKPRPIAASAAKCSIQDEYWRHIIAYENAFVQSNIANLPYILDCRGVLVVDKHT